MIMKTSKLIALLAMVICMCAACSTNKNGGKDESSDTSVNDSVELQESIYEESENTSINNSNQNKDSSTLMDEIGSDIESGADELLDDGNMNNSDDMSDSDKESSKIEDESSSIMNNETSNSEK